MRIPMILPLIFLSSFSVQAAPAVDNTVQALLDRSCQAGACVEGYAVKFRQITYEASRRQTTLNVSLLPNKSIDYPILDERFEAQLTQSSFSAVCRVKDVDNETFATLSRAEENDGTAAFREGLRACLTSLSRRTEAALGR